MTSRVLGIAKDSPGKGAKLVAIMEDGGNRLILDDEPRAADRARPQIFVADDTLLRARF